MKASTTENRFAKKADTNIFNHEWVQFLKILIHSLVMSSLGLKELEILFPSMTKPCHKGIANETHMKAKMVFCTSVKMSITIHSA